MGKLIDDMRSRLRILGEKRDFLFATVTRVGLIFFVGLGIVTQELPESGDRGSR